VLHAGLYYAPGSAKARLCREGKDALERYAQEKGIPVRTLGKLVVAVDASEDQRFVALKERAIANAVPGLEEVGPERIRELEPNVVARRGLWSPTTGIIDFARVTRAYADDVVASGGSIQLGWRATGFDVRGGAVTVTSDGGQSIRARHVVACGGLWSDRIGQEGRRSRDREMMIVPFRGDYYSLVGDARTLVRSLVYPVPDPRFPFLGVHFTRRHDDEVWAGPNAVLALRRTGYRRSDISVSDTAEVLAFPGFRRLAAKYWRTGAGELWRDLSKRAFLKDMQRYIPAIRSEDVRFGPSGVRAQAVRRDGTLVDDFDVVEAEGITHVRNAPSPAATASLAIGRMLASRTLERLEIRTRMPS
jgi:L-2-hydroxyglutarate oxidase LhgO